jgi:hypothetical protein
MKPQRTSLFALRRLPEAGCAALESLLLPGVSSLSLTLPFCGLYCLTTATWAAATSSCHACFSKHERQDGQPRAARDDAQARRRRCSTSKHAPTGHIHDAGELASKSIHSLNQDGEHPSQSKVGPHSEVVDDASDSDGADSVFSQGSLASTATSLGGISASTNDLITNLTSDLLCTEEMHAVNFTALKDQSIGPERYRRNVRRLIKLFGQDLRAKAKDSIQMMAARALQKRPISAHAALGTRKTLGGLAQCPR